MKVFNYFRSDGRISMQASIRLSFLLFLMIVFTLPSPTFASMVITDDFNDGVINQTLWTVSGDGVVTLNEANGVINATATGASAGITWLKSNLIASGDFDVSINYSWLSSFGTVNTRTRTQLYVYNPAESLSFALNNWRGGTPNSDLRFTYSNGSLIGNEWTPPSTGALRIARVGSIFEGYYWDRSWVSLGTCNGYTEDVHIAFNANLIGGNALNVKWDNFSLTADSISGLPVPEPSVLMLLCLSIAGILLIKRKTEAN